MLFLKATKFHSLHLDSWLNLSIL